MSKKERNPLNRSQNNRNRKDFIDYDYTSKLNPEELEFLKTFTSEYYGGDFKKNTTYIIEDGEFVQISNNKDRSKNRDLRKYVSITKYYKNELGEFTEDEEYKFKDSVLHKSKEHKKELYDSNNHRNRDLISSGYSRTNEDNDLHLDILGTRAAISITHFLEIRNDLITLLKVKDIDFDPDINDEDLINLIGTLIREKNSKNKDIIDLVREILFNIVD